MTNKNLAAIAVVFSLWAMASTGPSAPAQQEASAKASLRVTGKFLKAFLVAYQDFMKIENISRSKKNIENYSIGFNDDKINYYVFLTPIESGRSKSDVVGGGNEFGKQMRYTIRKSDYAIRQRAYYR